MNVKYDIKLMEQMIADGKKPREIAKAVGCKAEYVYKFKIRHGAPKYEFDENKFCVEWEAATSRLKLLGFTI